MYRIVSDGTISHEVLVIESYTNVLESSSDQIPFQTSDPNDSRLDISTKGERIYVTGEHCQTPIAERVTEINDTKYHYPLDYWPGVSGRPFRPCVEVTDVNTGEVRLKEINSGYLGAFFPSGMDSPSSTKSINRRLKIANDLGNNGLDLGVE